MCRVLHSRDRSGAFSSRIQEQVIRELRLTSHTLERWVSAERLGSYRAAGGDDVELYLWNAEASAGLFQIIGHLEVILRNVIHWRLSATSPRGEWWLDQTLRLDARAQADLAKALSRAKRHGQSTAGRLAAELSFGFWRYLLANTYRSTVWPRIQVGFAGLPKSQRDRADLEARCARIHALRNRIAHHEPIIRTDIARAVDDIDHLASALAPGSIGTLIDVAQVVALAGRRP